MAPRNCKSYIWYDRRSTVEDPRLCPLFDCLFLSTPAVACQSTGTVPACSRGGTGAIELGVWELSWSTAVRPVSEDLTLIAHLFAGTKPGRGAQATVASDCVMASL